MLPLFFCPVGVVGQGIGWSYAMEDERLSPVFSQNQKLTSIPQPEDNLWSYMWVCSAVDRLQSGARDRNLATCRNGEPMRPRHASSITQTWDNSSAMPMRTWYLYGSKTPTSGEVSINKFRSRLSCCDPASRWKGRKAHAMSFDRAFGWNRPC